jgi:hypothetical protein
VGDKLNEQGGELSIFYIMFDLTKGHDSFGGNIIVAH